MEDGGRRPLSARVDPITGTLVCALDSNSSDQTDPADACRLERTLPANVKMRVELDFTFYQPNISPGNNIQLFAMYSGAADTKAYLGLYLQAASGDQVSVVLTYARMTGALQILGTGSLPLNTKTHVALDVSFGSGSAVFFDSLGATPAKTQPFTSSDEAPVMRLGLSRQNGGTDALRGDYDDFRVTKLDAF